MFLLYHKTTRPTGRELARALGIPSGMENRRVISPMIRWGSAIEHRAETLLNPREAILRSSNKLVALRKMKEAGVRVPDVLLVPNYLAERPNGVWLGRKCHGMQGRDIQVFTPERPGELRGIDFFSRYIPNRREYRLHVFRDKVIRVQGKYLDHPEQHTNQYIKNHEQGFRFRAPRNQLRPERTEMAIKAVQAVGLDFGAVDVLIGEDGLTYVLEVNSAPACSPRTAACYVAEFVRVAQERGIELRPQYDALAVLAPEQGE
jgi:glutathione synthase/RimK-type ligase-like ATP-grasp enzyme